MKKDPAVLLYFRDFLVSTDLMTNEEVGAHIRVLCHQADKGHLYEDSIRERICGPIWERIRDRYKQDELGRWYHPKMEKVLSERKNYVESRVLNLHGNPIREPHKGTHMGGSSSSIPSSSSSGSPSSVPMVKRAFAQPTLEDVRAYCLERKNGIDPEKWIDHYTSNGWRVGKNPMKDWKAAVRNWEKGEFGNRRFEKPKLTKELLQRQMEAINGL